MRRIAPAAMLFVLAPLIAEYLLGDLTVLQLPALVLLAPLYGSGAILIREVTRRSGRGWPTMLVLAVAYGLVEEGIGTMSLFNPDYAHAHLLDHGFVPALGIALPWTMHVLTLHAVWSIATPIAVVELVAGRRSTEPWLGRTGLITCGVLLTAGMAGAVTTSLVGSPFVATPVRLAVVAVVAAALVVVALRSRWFAARPAGAAAPRRRAPRPWQVGAAALLAGVCFELLAVRLSAYLVVPGLAVVQVTTIALLGRWSASAGWRAEHRLALVAAALAVYAGFGFAGSPITAASPAVVLASHVLFAAGGAALFGWTARRVPAGRSGRHEAGDPPGVRSATRPRSASMY